MTFQALSAMTPVPGYDGFDDFDPSDEGEIARITERSKNEEDAISAYEESFITELGIDPEFFEAR
jgi:hypothetical protein